MAVAAGRHETGARPDREFGNGRGIRLRPRRTSPASATLSYWRALALWALARDYGQKEVVHCGPLLDKVAIEGDKAVLSFKHAGSGLKNKAGGDSLSFFEIAGEDCKYESADAWIENDTVIVRSSEIPSPVHVRYLFRKPAPNPEFSLMNAEGLPASPFMTDDFKPTRQPLPELTEAQKNAIEKQKSREQRRKRKQRS